MAAHSYLPSTDPGLSLALAMVVSSTAPLLLLDGDLNIVAASGSFCREFGISPDTTAGRQLFDLGQGEWDVPQLRCLLDATASGDAKVEAYEMDLKREGQASRCLVLNVQKLAYADQERMRLLVAVNDVTETRSNEKKADAVRRESEARNQELLRENEVLLQEIRHRVANSLQIIASVLMQNARRTSSEETRNHLRDAHQRVMAIADLQQQLASSTLGTVRLRAYLTKLCDTIAASMIGDPKALALEVTSEDVVIDAGVSVSLGLIVTELVINALKHAFPGGRGGRIVVDYRADGPAWTLSVSDNGVGMPPTESTVTSGLGTSIIQALAHQLHATVDVDRRGRGTCVSVQHVSTDAADDLMPELAAV